MASSSSGSVWSVRGSAELYGVSSWGDGYFGISEEGNLTISVERSGSGRIEIVDVVDELERLGLKPPFLLRFPQLIRDRLESLYGAFEDALREFRYDGVYRFVFPLKVNQRRSVIDSLLAADLRGVFGLEVGSRSELLIAIPYQARYGLSLVCDGHKDDQYLLLALKTTQLNKNTIIVASSVNEVEEITSIAKKLGIVPQIGVRIKLDSKGSGRWGSAGGDGAKFGLNTTELLDVIKTLRKKGMLSSIEMLHFHIGSQITDINHIRRAVNEAARVYAKLSLMGLEVTYFNVGGGLAVNYDGTKRTSHSSANYTVREYAKSVVQRLKTVCDEEGVSYPTILSESGRTMTAHHATLIASVIGAKKKSMDRDVNLGANDSQVLSKLYDCYRVMNSKNYEECYHTALRLREELSDLFRMGFLELEERSKGEELFWKILENAARLSADDDAENRERDREELNRKISDIYITNFSIFQSIPDSWAIDQIFPILPIHRLNEEPTVRCRVVDITCDSDGEIERSLKLHRLDRRPYYLAIPMIGAYQETLGNYHDLLGRVNEAHIRQKMDGSWEIEKILHGDSIKDVLKITDHESSKMVDTLRESLREREKESEVEEFIDLYKETLERQTYLEAL